MALLLALAASCGGMRHIAGDRSLRAAQPTADEIEWAARTHGVRTVISLRAVADGKPWYDAEVAICEQLGLEHASLGWSARSTSDAQVDELVALLERCEHPVLIHCRSGHDRTSLGAAIYRSVVLGHADEDADDELSFVPHGHLPFFGYEAMDEAWRRFVERRRKGSQRAREAHRDATKPSR